MSVSVNHGHACIMIWWPQWVFHALDLQFDLRWFLCDERRTEGMLCVSHSLTTNAYIKYRVCAKCRQSILFIIKTKLSVILVMTLYIWWSEHWYGSLHYHWFFYHVDNKHRHCISLWKMVDDNNNEIQISVWSCQKAGVPQKAFCVYFCQLLFC